MKKISMTFLRKNYHKIMRSISTGKSYEITKYGKLTGALVSWKDYKRLITNLEVLSSPPHILD